jgi:hypothetical protein
MSTSTIHDYAESLDVDISAEVRALENMHIEEDNAFNLGPIALLSAPFQMIMDTVESPIARNTLSSESGHFEYLNDSQYVIRNENDEPIQSPKPKILVKNNGHCNTFTAIAPAGTCHNSVKAVAKQSPRW